ncbi:hypothetical protein LCGC14_2913510, partial [marine sediment metagenome]
KTVKKHKHKEGLPEHEENVPFHEHKEGEGHEILTEEETMQHDVEITQAAAIEAENVVITKLDGKDVEVYTSGFNHEHTEMFPLHTHTMGEEKRQHGNSDPMSDTDLVHDEDAGIEPAEETAEGLAIAAGLDGEMSKFGHVHSEFYPYHYHEEGSNEPSDVGDPEQQHGYEGADYDATQTHDVDTGIEAAAEVVEGAIAKVLKSPPVSKRKTKTKKAVKKAKTAKK